MARLAKLIVLGFGFLLVPLGFGQAADVKIKLDLLLAPTWTDREPTLFKLYDRLGKFSTVSLSGSLETGWKFYVSQRLQKIDGDPDSGLLDEFYVEDTGLWRVGKQYLPFGRRLMRESVLAVRGDSNLLFEGVPLSLAVLDGGKTLQSGVVARIGPPSFGVSLAVGQHFGINGSALTLIRTPEEFLPRGRGYRQAFGADFRRRSGKWTAEGEVIALRGAHLGVDRDIIASDLLSTFQIRKAASMGVGWTRQWDLGQDTFRASARIPVIDKISFEPLVRMRGSRLLDITFVIRISL